MRLFLSLLFCFFMSNASAALTVKRLCVTSGIKSHEPIDQLALKDIRKQQFYIFVELNNCDQSSLLLKIITAKGIIKKKFCPKKSRRYRTYYKFKNIDHIQNIEIVDSSGMVVRESVMNTNSPSVTDADKKTSQKAKPRGMKKLLQSMQDKKQS